ncbi:MAG: hypothetical protein NTY38_09275, partial [Acidobacteria bacterium]|nr:hypothetical protein [Acidobacteriota bacterium]
PLTEHLDLAAFRPKPKTRILMVAVRQKTPYWLGWPGSSYDLAGKHREFSDAFAQSAARLGITLEQHPDPVDPSGGLEEVIRKLQSQPPDAVLIHIEHLGSWGMAAKIISGGGVPAIVFAPIGMAFTGHVKDISRQRGVHVISSLETSAVEQAMRMVRAKRQFAESRLLVVAGKERKESTLETLGTKVRHIPRSSMNELFQKMPETAEARDVARKMRRGAKKTVEPTEQDTLNAARSFLAAKRLLRDEESNAMTSDCLGMVQTKVMPTPPCMAATLFQDAGVTYGCEADVFGAVSLMFSSYLFDKPGFMNDPVPETVKNHLIAAHCVSPTLLNGFGKPAEPYILRSHSESSIGVSLQVLWREGQPVTLVRFKNPNELIVDTGKVVCNVDTPPAGGCRTSFEIAMDKVEDVRDVLGFHQVVFYGDHRRDIGAFCQMYGIKAIHSPEHSPEPSAGAESKPA